jgi:hypothetical protein
MSRPDVVASCEAAKRIVDALLMATSEDVHEKLTRLDKGQPGSVLRSLRLTRDRLTGERGSEIMLKGPTAKRLTVRVNELVGNVGLVGASVFDLSEEDREHANRSPVALSIPLRDDLVRASSTIDRLLGRAVELRNWREVKEAELANLVETSDPAANAIRHQRRAEIAGEIALVNQRETELLGDVYEVSSAVRRGLEERTQLLSSLIRLGLGSIPKSQVIFQPFTAGQLTNLSIGARAEVWLRMTSNERATMIETDYAVLRNLDGLPLSDREKMQELFVRNVFHYGPEEARAWLISMGFLRTNGELGQRFVMLDLDRQRYITAHGCTSYTDIQVNLEGTSTDPADPNGTGNLDKLDKQADYVRTKRKGCIAYLNFRNADFPPTLVHSAVTTRFSVEDRRRYNDFIQGVAEAGDGSVFFDTRFHSAGNGMVPDFEQAKYVDRIWMDDPALNGFVFDEVSLPSGVLIVMVKQDGLIPLLIRNSDKIPRLISPILDSRVRGKEDVSLVQIAKESRRHTAEDNEWIYNLPDEPEQWWLRPAYSILGLGSYVEHEKRQLLERLLPFDINLSSPGALVGSVRNLMDGHSDGSSDEWQWDEQALLREEARKYSASEE